MTEKQEKIIRTALQLFAENGFDATSTSKIAKTAGVSEGLIFRHFGNKDGLLSAIMELGREKAHSYYQIILGHDNPKMVIKGIIELPFTMEEEDTIFWKLLYAMKWQTEVYDNTISQPLREGLEMAFSTLNYKNPIAEAELIMVLIDGLATSLLLRKPEHQEALLQSILEKYQL